MACMVLRSDNSIQRMGMCTSDHQRLTEVVFWSPCKLLLYMLILFHPYTTLQILFRAAQLRQRSWWPSICWVLAWLHLRPGELSSSLLGRLAPCATCPGECLVLLRLIWGRAFSRQSLLTADQSDRYVLKHSKFSSQCYCTSFVNIVWWQKNQTYTFTNKHQSIMHAYRVCDCIS